MSRFVRGIMGSLLAAALILTSSVVSMAAVETTEKIKVGIYYNDSKTGINKAVDSFAVNADKGTEFGFYSANVFVPVYAESSANAINIRKDSSFYIQIGDKFNDSALANLQVLALKQKGIKAYITYKDGWWIWTGSYQNQITASTDILVNLQKKDASAKYTIIEPSINRVTGITASGDITFIFDSSIACLQVRPKAENNPYMLKLDGKGYRGELEVKRLKESDMTVINVLPIEEYLYGVIPAEIEADAHIEAIKAQAVAARTYTLNNLGKYSRLGFDLCNTVYSQVYKGFGGESAIANKAVDATKGKKVMYDGKTAQVFYFSSSGGRTEDAKNVWGNDIPYLKSVDDKYELTSSSHYNWETTLTANQIKQILLSKEKDIGEIVSLEVVKRSEAGRITELLIKGTKSQVSFTNSSVREIFKLDSQWYDITTNAQVQSGVTGSATVGTLLGQKQVITATGIKTIAAGNVMIVGANGSKTNVASAPTEYKFTGKGWGHSVGMSQEGAKGMANAGFTYDQILKHYFTGTTIE